MKMVDYFRAAKNVRAELALVHVSTVITTIRYFRQFHSINCRGLQSSKIKQMVLAGRDVSIGELPRA